MNHDQLKNLIDGLLEKRLSESDQVELVETLRKSAAARHIYWELVEQETLLQEVVRESAGRDLARMAANDLSMDRPSAVHPFQRKSKSAWNSIRWIVVSSILLATVFGMTLSINFYWKPSSTQGTHSTRQSIAALLSLEGDVWLVDALHRSIKVSSGQQFFGGDTLRVGAEGKSEVTLTDGSRLVLGADSVLQFRLGEEGRKRRLHLERGAAEVEAARQSPEHPLIFSTREARLMVLGTRFRLYAGTGDSRVELDEGKVQFARQSDGESVEVAAGQYAIALAGDEPLEPLVAQPFGEDWRLRQTLLRAGRQVAFSHGGLSLATGDHARIKVWEVATGELTQTLKTSAWSDNLAFTTSDQAVVALSEGGRALIWDLGGPDAIHTELKCGAGNLRRCAISPHGRWLAQTSSVDSGYLPIWKVDESGVISPVRSIPMKMGSVTLAESEAGPVVVASQWNGTTVKWDAMTGDELVRYRFRSELYRTALSIDGRLLAGYGNAEGLLLVDTVGGASRNLWPPGSVRVNCLRFATDGQAVFAAMEDGVVRAWSTVDGRPLLVLSTGDARLTALDVSTDSNWLATAGDGNNVKIWQRKAN